MQLLSKLMLPNILQSPMKNVNNEMESTPLRSVKTNRTPVRQICEQLGAVILPRTERFEFIGCEGVFQKD